MRTRRLLRRAGRLSRGAQWRSPTTGGGHPQSIRLYSPSGQRMEGALVSLDSRWIKRAGWTIGLVLLGAAGAIAATGAGATGYATSPVSAGAIDLRAVPLGDGTPARHRESATSTRASRASGGSAARWSTGRGSTRARRRGTRQRRSPSTARSSGRLRPTR